LFQALAGNGGASAVLAPESVIRVDVATRATRAYPLPGAIAVALDDAGKLYAATSDALYAEDDRGELVLRFRATMGAIHGLVASKGHIWFAEGSELGTIQKGSVLATSGANLPPDARLWPSTTSDVWLVSHGKLLRFAQGDGIGIAQWFSYIQPIFARACAKCHLPNGPAGVDLSTEAAWRARKSDIRERVVEERTMPPKGHPLDDADRGAIRHWLEGVR
jgi:hypothetical protein